MKSSYIEAPPPNNIFLFDGMALLQLSKPAINPNPFVLRRNFFFKFFLHCHFVFASTRPVAYITQLLAVVA
ncbi:MAG: hypothetical protein AB7H77_07365 [Bdellovibrionales bacterium]